MEFKYHPIIEGLKVNEDGSEVLLNGELLAQFENDKARKNPTMKVNFNGKAHSVTRLVCESWNGLSQHVEQRVSKIDQFSNHYSNLEWKEGSSNGIANFVQKISNSDIQGILDMINLNQTMTEIAKKYNVHVSRISRINKKYGKEN
jgi:hypothetical protein